MSVICEINSGVVISHSHYVRDIYENVKKDERLTCMKLNEKLFDINEPYKVKNQTLGDRVEAVDWTADKGQIKQRKRKRVVQNQDKEDINRLQEEINHVKAALSSLVECGRQKQYFLLKCSSEGADINNKSAKEFSDKVYAETASKPVPAASGGNTEAMSIVVPIFQSLYLIPPNCEFYCHDVQDLGTKLLPCRKKFDLILLDPPWWNKYVRRKKAKHSEASYKMLYNKDLAEMPLSQLTARGALVAVWCTNAPSHRKALLEECFPAWGLTFVGRWYWLKVTKSGEPVCSFMPPLCKQPFEQIYFGVAEGRHELGLETPVDSKILVSIPSALHSHKPPLADVLSQYLPSNPRCLELFARYLLPGWVSYGNEVLRLQNIALYEEIDVLLQ